MFLNKKGGQPTTVDDRAFLELIREIYDGEPKLFGLEATSAGDLLEKFIIFWSFRCGSESRAGARKGSDADRCNI